MKRCVALFLALGMLLSGCAFAGPTGPEQYSVTYLDLFDTVTTVIGTAQTEAEFRQNASEIHDRLLAYHQLFDIYHDYDQVNNLKTVNDQAGVAPVKVDPAIIALLQSCKEYYRLTDGKVNAAMGSVLKLWHGAREDSLRDPANARLPDDQALLRGAEHMDFDRVIIDEEASTVYLSDPEQYLDVGAIAKGWALQRVAETAQAGMLISVGGNVYATGSKYGDGTPWVVGIQRPDQKEGYLHTIRITEGAVVTSGDYQRFFTVGEKAYHHIIDPETRMPASFFSSVTVVCPDSGLADALSTALFVLPLEEGQALAEACGAQVLWVDREGREFMTPGFRELIQK